MMTDQKPIDTDEVRKRHEVGIRYVDDGVPVEECCECELIWPCDAIRLCDYADEIDNKYIEYGVVQRQRGVKQAQYEARLEIDRLREEIGARKEYIELLEEELEDVIPGKYAEGWRSRRYEKGVVLRDKIARAALKGEKDD